eukprot:5801835-Prorocentrum_lima.AAC.1
MTEKQGSLSPTRGTHAVPVLAKVRPIWPSEPGMPTPGNEHCMVCGSLIRGGGKKPQPRHCLCGPGESFRA